MKRSTRREFLKWAGGTALATSMTASASWALADGSSLGMKPISAEDMAMGQSPPADRISREGQCGEKPTPDPAEPSGPTEGKCGAKPLPSPLPPEGGCGSRS